MTEEHKIIWLQPSCEKCALFDDSPGGRQWCQDDVWERCEDCGKPSVKYVLADAAIAEKERE